MSTVSMCGTIRPYSMNELHATVRAQHNRNELHATIRAQHTKNDLKTTVRA